MDLNTHLFSVSLSSSYSRTGRKEERRGERKGREREREEGKEWEVGIEGGRRQVTGKGMHK